MTDKNNRADGPHDHATGAGPIRLLVLDRQTVVRQGLRMRLALEEDLEVVGEAVDADGAIPLAQALRPDVILMEDVEAPGRFAITEALRAASPRSAVVVLTDRDDAATWERDREAGATALVAKLRAEGMRLAAIRGVAVANAKRRRHERASERRSKEMPCVTIEVGEGAVTRRVRIIAPSIERAMKMAGDGKPGRRTRLLFPTDPEAFFPEESERREAA